MYPLLVLAMHGIGDSIFQRPFVERLARDRGRVLLCTSWPELFEDIPGVEFVRPDDYILENLRTQRLNVERQPDSRWSPRPLQAERLRPMYRLRDPSVSVMQELVRGFKLPGRFRPGLSLPSFGKPPVRYKKYAVVRPVTLRKEWRNDARAPKPEYVAEAAEVLRALGYRVVTLAHVEPDRRQEWTVGDLPQADKEFLAGELDVREMMALIEGASLVTGGVGFILPASIAYRTPCVMIGGGQGGYNAPGVVTSPGMDLSALRWLLPDRYCRCTERFHDCPKDIPNFGDRFISAVAELDEVQAAA